VKDSGFRVYKSWFRGSGLEFRVTGLGFRFGDQGLGLRVLD